VKKRSLIASLIVFFTILGGITYVEALNITLTWKPNSEPDLAGYILYYQYNSAGSVNVLGINDPNSSTVIVEINDEQHIDEGMQFTLTAYDIAGLESDYSNIEWLLRANFKGLSTDGVSTFDAIVDGLDLMYFCSNFGKTVASGADAECDFDNSGLIDGIDLANFSIEWTNHFTFHFPPS